MPLSRLTELKIQFNRSRDDFVDWLAAGEVDHGEAKEREQELERREREIRELESVEEMHGRYSQQAADARQVTTRHTHAGDRSGAPPAIGQGSLGEQVGKALSAKPLVERKHFEHEFQLDTDSYLGVETKATMTIATGWVPPTQYQPRIIDKIAAPIELLSLFPTLPVDSPTQSYQEETTSTSSAVEINENTVYPEAAIALTARTATVRKIGTHLPVTDELLADVPGVAQFLDGRLRYFVRKRLDLQLMAGDGVAPNILGLLNTPSILTQALGGNDVPDAVYKAMDQIAVTGQASPNAIIMHRNDFQPVRLMKTSLGYTWGPPSVQGPTSMWGIPVILTSAITEGTALVGDFSMCTLYLRQDAIVEIGYIGDDFKFGRQALRASLRGVLVTFRPQAFCVVTGV